MAESPAVKDLPKIDDTLKGQLLGSHNLKHQEAAEKNVLPSAQDIKEEKIHENVLTGITGFDQTKLKDVETKEKVVLPDSEQIQTEKTHQNLLHGVEGGVQLKHVKTREPSTPTSTMQVKNTHAENGGKIIVVENTIWKKSLVPKNSSMLRPENL